MATQPGSIDGVQNSDTALSSACRKAECIRNGGGECNATILTKIRSPLFVVRAADKRTDAASGEACNQISNLYASGSSGEKRRGGGKKKIQSQGGFIKYSVSS